MKALVNRKVLVLNKKWTAVGIVGLRRAILMLFSTDAASGLPKAEIIDEHCVPWTWAEWSELRPEEGEDGISSVNGIYKIPTVIKLNGYDRIPQQKVQFSRKALYKRDHYSCQYCGYKPPKSKKGAEDEYGELTVDHINPRACGGTTTWENCILACVGCNTKKANLAPKPTTVLVDGKEVPGFIVSFREGKRVYQRTIPQPKRPKHNFFKGDIRYESWKQWLELHYWYDELENDNKE